MENKYALKINTWNIEFSKHNGNGYLIASILDEDRKIIQDTSISKSKLRDLIEYLETVEKEIVE